MSKDKKISTFQIFCIGAMSALLGLYMYAPAFDSPITDSWLPALLIAGAVMLVIGGMIVLCFDLSGSENVYQLLADNLTEPMARIILLLLSARAHAVGGNHPRPAAYSLRALSCRLAQAFTQRRADISTAPHPHYDFICRRLCDA